MLSRLIDLFETICFWAVVYERFKPMAPKKGEERVYRRGSGERLTSEEIYRRAQAGLVVAYERDKFWKKIAEGKHGPS